MRWADVGSHSATSQFFINVRNNDALNRSRAGRRRLRGVRARRREWTSCDARTGPTGTRGGHKDVPIDTISITATGIVDA
jgi:cyclophilin family peptidyl-prolyl cis-trans isomerase